MSGKTHMLLANASYQCAHCRDMVQFDELLLTPSSTYATAECHKCEVRFKVPLTLIECEIVT